jgi:hypothetical protein
MPATPTSGSDRSRCPALRWQLLQDIRPGAKAGASAGVLVKSLKPHRMSADSFESSRLLSVSGFFGKSHAVTIVVRAGMSGPTRGTPDEVVGTGARAQPLTVAARTIDAAIRGYAALGIIQRKSSAIGAMAARLPLEFIDPREPGGLPFSRWLPQQ